VSAGSDQGMAVGVAAGFAAPVLNDRARRRRPILVWTCVATVVGMAGYLVAPPDRVGAAAGVVFSVGHVGGLLGPQLGGYLRDLTGRYEAGIAVMLVMTVVMTAFALAIPETYGGVKREGRL